MYSSHQGSMLCMILYGFATLFVASDSDDALRELRAALPGAGWRGDVTRTMLARADVQRTAHTDMRIEHAMKAGHIEPWREFYSTLVDLQLLSGCDGLVGKVREHAHARARAICLEM